MSGGFKRSAWFGIVGLFVVAGACVAIGLTLGSGQSDPKPAYGLIFGVLAIYFAILFTLQRGDLERTASSGARATARAVAETGGEIENPTTMAEPELWAALAIKPIDNDAIRARAEMWGAARGSLRLGMVVTLLIFLTVPSIYLFESFVPLLIGGPLIAIAAIYGSIRAVAPGGEMAKGYENVGRAMAPLGFEVTERPTVSIETRDAVTGRVGPKIRGALVLSGERHGRQVTVRLEGGSSEVKIAEPSHEFSARSKKTDVEGGPEGIVVARKGGEQSDWLCDLWLAERLAEA
ncbi:MAG TPA: hypothetical protein VF176_03675 [Solirubrobacterales bacterium]